MGSLSPEEAKKHMQVLTKKIWEANQTYFNENREVVPESVRDQMKQELILLEEAYPQYQDPNSPTQRVGSPLDGKLPKILHKSRRYSLLDAFCAEDIQNFCNRVERFFQTSEIEYSCEAKIDGLNITCWYEKGHFVKAITRGDGFTGEDVTHTIRTCENLPLTLPFPFDLEISGECFIAKQDFIQIQQENPNTSYANARNLCAWSVRQLDPKVAKKRYLRIFFYELGEHKNIPHKKIPQTQKELFLFFDHCFLPHQPELKICKNSWEIKKYCQESGNQKKQNNLFYETDGIVIKIHNLRFQKQMGYTAKVAKYALAYKFPATQKYTQLLDVHFQVGRTGSITPVAILFPISLDGSTISRATLHNKTELERKNIKIGDHIIIQKAGDIIPEVVEPLTDMRTGKEKNISFPQICPECNHELEQSGPLSRCPNYECPAKHREGLFYFAKQLKIEGLGPKTIQAMLDLELIHDSVDIWKLSNNDLWELPGFKEKKIMNLLEALKQKKALSLDVIFTGLGILGIGSENAKLFAHFFQNTLNNPSLFEIISYFETLESANIFEKINGIGQKNAQSFFAYFKTGPGRSLLHKFISQDIQIIWEEKSVSSSKNTYIFGKKFVITGTFSSFSRNELKKKITYEGWKVLSSISSRVDILLCGEKPGSKYTKVQNLNILIWKEKEVIKNIF